MYSDVVVGWDGSEGARDALGLADLLCAAAGTVTAACVHAATEDERGADLPGPAAAKAALGEVRTTDRPGARPLATDAVPAAAVADGLLQATERHGAGLLVVGSSRYGPVGRVHTGGVGRSLIWKAGCAFALPPRGYRAERREMRRIGVALDGTHQLAAARQAGALARDLGATVDVLCVIPELGRWARDAGDHVGYSWDNISRRHRDQYRDLLEQAVGELGTHAGSARLVQRGVAAEALAAASRRLALLVTGPAATHDLERLVAGVTAGTLHSVHCPVLVCCRDGATSAGSATAGDAARA